MPNIWQSPSQPQTRPIAYMSLESGKMRVYRGSPNIFSETQKLVQNLFIIFVYFLFQVFLSFLGPYCFCFDITPPPPTSHFGGTKAQTKCCYFWVKVGKVKVETNFCTLSHYNSWKFPSQHLKLEYKNDRFWILVLPQNQMRKAKAAFLCTLACYLVLRRKTAMQFLGLDKSLLSHLRKSHTSI
jgi:hypothetical protein